MATCIQRLDAARNFQKCRLKAAMTFGHLAMLQDMTEEEFLQVGIVGIVLCCQMSTKKHQKA